MWLRNLPKSEASLSAPAAPTKPLLGPQACSLNSVYGHLVTTDAMQIINEPKAVGSQQFMTTHNTAASVMSSPKNQCCTHPHLQAAVTCLTLGQSDLGGEKVEEALCWM